jgi:hypothetical protein
MNNLYFLTHSLFAVIETPTNENVGFEQWHVFTNWSLSLANPSESLNQASRKLIHLPFFHPYPQTFPIFCYEKE